MGADKARPVSEEARQFGEKLAALRKSLGVSRRALAAQCGTCEPSLSPYEKGLRLPRLSLVQKIASVLKVHPLDLLPFWRPAPVRIEVCQWAGDWQPGGEPKYHAQISGSPGMWAAGLSADEAVGNLIRTHPEAVGVEFVRREGLHAR